jgi:hypothetical protein
MEITAEQKIELIKQAIANARVRPQFLLISSATVSEFIAHNFMELSDPQEQGSPPILSGTDVAIVPCDYVVSFLLVAEVPQKQASLADLPEEAIIKPRFKL